MHRLIPKHWRGRLTYTLMSLFVGWHSLAMVVAPAPDNDSMRWLFPPFKPYLTLFNISGQWGFFSPDVGPGMVLRYVIEDTKGKRHFLQTLESLNRYDPMYFRYASLYREIIGDGDFGSDTNSIFAAERFCRQNASLHPVAITLAAVNQKILWPKDYMKGKRPLDADFVTVKTLKPIRCPGR